MIGDSPAQEWLRSRPPLPPRTRRRLRRDLTVILVVLAGLSVLAALVCRHGL